MTFEKRNQSIRYAFQGLRIAWRGEASFRIEVVWGIATLVLGWYFGITETEWLIVLFIIGFVLSTEALNTALEELCDKFQPTQDPHIAKIKDLAAAAVFIAATTAFIVGMVIFLPHVLSLL